MDSAILLFWLVATGYSIFAVFKPIRPFSKRWQAGIGLLAVQIVSVLLASLTDFPHKDVSSDKAGSSAIVTRDGGDQQRKTGYHVRSASGHSDTLPSDPYSLAMLRKADDSVIAVGKSGFYEGAPNRNLLTITINDDTTSDKDYLFATSQSMVMVANYILRNNASGVTDLRFLLRTTSEDVYGKTSPSVTFLIDVSVDQLRSGSWKDFTGWDLLNISHVEKKVAGYKLAEAYCQVPDNAHYARRFCGDMLTDDTQEKAGE